MVGFLYTFCLLNYSPNQAPAGDVTVMFRTGVSKQFFFVLFSYRTSQWAGLICFGSAANCKSGRENVVILCWGPIEHLHELDDTIVPQSNDIRFLSAANKWQVYAQRAKLDKIDHEYVS